METAVVIRIDGCVSANTNDILLDTIESRGGDILPTRIASQVGSRISKVRCNDLGKREVNKYVGFLRPLNRSLEGERQVERRGSQLDANRTGGRGDCLRAENTIERLLADDRSHRRDRMRETLRHGLTQIVFTEHVHRERRCGCAQRRTRNRATVWSVPKLDRSGEERNKVCRSVRWCGSRDANIACGQWPSQRKHTALNSIECRTPLHTGDVRIHALHEALTITKHLSLLCCPLIFVGVTWFKVFHFEFPTSFG